MMANGANMPRCFAADGTKGLHIQLRKWVRKHSTVFMGRRALDAPQLLRGCAAAVSLFGRA